MDFDVDNNNFLIVNMFWISLLTFYDLRDAEHCQSSYGGTSIPGSSIGDHLPCVEPLSELSSQSFTNERRLPACAHGVPPYGMVCLLHW